jgi:diketogulonate reductase-like aldo/keto reductase
VSELARLQKEGKIVHIGLSNVSEEEIQIALSIARIESVQNRCNPFQQTDIRNGLIDFCLEREISYLPYSPVGGSHSYRLLGQNPTLIDLCNKYSATPYSLTLAWLLSKGENVIPIPGASRVESIQNSVTAVSLEIEPDDLETLDHLSPI